MNADRTSLVDRPREADVLAGLMRQLTGRRAAQRRRLARRWAAGDDVSTEDLRFALRRNRMLVSKG